MKFSLTRLLLCLCLVLPAPGATVIINSYRFMGGGGGGNIIADLWETFEGGTLDPSTLQANDHHASALWAVTGVGKDTNSAAERATISTINSVADTGTLGFRRDHNTGTGRVELDLGVYPTTQYVRFWFQVTTLDDGGLTRIVGYGEDGSNIIVGLEVDRAGATYTAKLYHNSAGSSSTITISAATWYSATIKIVKNGTCLLQIYDTASAQVGVEQSLTGLNLNFFYHEITPSPSTSATGSTYIDDYVIANTAAVYPILP